MLPKCWVGGEREGLQYRLGEHRDTLGHFLAAPLEWAAKDDRAPLKTSVTVHPEKMEEAAVAEGESRYATPYAGMPRLSRRRMGVVYGAQGGQVGPAPQSSR